MLSDSIAQRPLVGLAAIFVIGDAVGLGTGHWQSAAGAWLVAPLLVQNGVVASYAVLGGASTEGLLRSIFGFFQLGYFALPLFFIAGVARALKGKEMFALFLIADCLLVLVFATSPDVNALAPFLDGLRFMPSIFLPLFFISGAGALSALEWAVAAWRGLGKKFGLDRLDVSVTFAFTVLVPLASLFAALAMPTMDQYAAGAASVSAAAEYSDLQSAYGVIGQECAVMLGKNAVSFYPIYGGGFARTYLFDGNVSQAADAMGKWGCRYLLLGSTQMLANSSQAPIWKEYSAIANDTRFEEIRYGGAVHLFALKGAPAQLWAAPPPGSPPSWLAPLFAACAAVVTMCGIAAWKMDG